SAVSEASGGVGGWEGGRPVAVSRAVGLSSSSFSRRTHQIRLHRWRPHAACAARWLQSVTQDWLPLERIGGQLARCGAKPEDERIGNASALGRLVSSEETAVKDAPTALEKKKKASGARKRASVTLLADATTALPTAGGLVVAAVETKEAEHASAKLEMAVVPAAKRQTSTKNGATREREQQLWAKGYTHVIGVDEAGRGPLAGPVVAAACVLPPGVDIPGINDSKQVDEASRERLYEAVTGT
ncbi:hypothetical protein QJQ45_013745, partial [Haematococcus lacustris]